MKHDSTSSTSSGSQDLGAPKLSMADYFDPDMVVSRNSLGEPVSFYRDGKWKLDAQSSDGTSGISLVMFASDATERSELIARTIAQHKALVWLYIDAGDPIAALTAKVTCNAAKGWCTAAIERNMDLLTILSNAQACREVAAEMNVTYLALTKALISTMARNRAALRIAMPVPTHKLHSILAKEIADREECRQTPLIPSRIYCAILAGLVAHMDVIERDVEQLANAYRASARVSQLMPKHWSAQKRVDHRAEQLAPLFDLMETWGYESARDGTLLAFLQARLNLYQCSLMHTVVAFSGMRISEVEVLPLIKVVRTVEHRGRSICLIDGYTKKFNGGVKTPATWITSREGHRAINLACKIADVMRDIDARAPAAGQEPLLFPSTVDRFRVKSRSTIAKAQLKLVELICPLVTQGDIDELSRLELDRGWMRDGIDVGARWPLTFHQLRRSLSVYAHASGMVSFPSLKAQLKHITDQLRAYYSDGFNRAVNLVADKRHFSAEFKAAKAESTTFGATLRALFPEREYLGLGARQTMATVSSRTGKQTMSLVQRGLLAYKETVLGGCTSVEPCALTPLQVIGLKCLKKRCTHMVLKQSRLDSVISTKRATVTALESEHSGSVEHRLEAADLAELLDARSKLFGSAA